MTPDMTPDALILPPAVPSPHPSFADRIRLRKSRVLVGLGLGLAAELFLDGRAFGLSHALFAVLLGSALVVEAGREAWHQAGPHRWLLFGAVLLLASTMLHASTWLAVMSSVASVLLFALAIQGWTGERELASLRTGQLLGAPFVTVGHSLYAGGLTTAHALEDAKVNSVVSRHGPAALRLVLIVVPPTLALLFLLSSGDAVFRARLEGFEAALFGVPLEGFVRGSFVTLVSAVSFAGALATASRRRDHRAASAPGRVLRATEALALLGTLTSLLLVFGLTSTPCALAPASCELPAGVTYAGAAHEGFFQLLFAAVGILLLLMALPARTALETPRAQRTFTALSTALVLATMPMVVSAVARLWRYETTYGLTVLRLLAYAGLFLVSAVLAWRALTLWALKRAFVGGAIGLCTATLLGLAVLAPDDFIARRNVRMDAVDTAYLLELSEDALPALVESGQFTSLPPVREDSLLEWNLGRARARAALGTLHSE